MDKDINQQIEQLSRVLHLPAFRSEYQQQAKDAAAEALSYEAFLLRLMEREHLNREENRRKAHIRLAGFTQYKYLHDLKKEELGEDVYPGRSVKLLWDNNNMKITNLDEVNQFVKREYRQGWKALTL